MNRPQPSKILIERICAGKGRLLHLIASVHHGLADTPLARVYPFLNLTETLAFAAASRQVRTFDLPWVRSQLDGGATLYDIFRAMYGHDIAIYGNLSEKRLENVYQWLGRHRSLSSPSQQDLARRLDPYRPRELSDRLHAVPAEAVEELMCSLRKPAPEWVTESVFHELRQYDDRPRRIMFFQKDNSSPKKVRACYAAEISRILGEYSTEMVAETPVVRRRESPQLGLCE